MSNRMGSCITCGGSVLTDYDNQLIICLYCRTELGIPRPVSSIIRGQENGPILKAVRTKIERLEEKLVQATKKLEDQRAYYSAIIEELKKPRRGRPKGSKNKEHKQQQPEQPKRPRGRPKGSKNKPKEVTT